MAQTFKASITGKEKVYSYGPTSPSSQHILDSSSSVGSVNEKYEKYKKEKMRTNKIVEEVKKKDMDIEAYIRESLENPLTEDENSQFESPSSSIESPERRKRSNRKALKESKIKIA